MKIRFALVHEIEKRQLWNISRNENILQNPALVIIVQDFGEYAISIRILFWIADLSVAGSMRSTAMIDTKKVLSEAGIQLQVRPLS